MHSDKTDRMASDSNNLAGNSVNYANSRLADALRNAVKRLIGRSKELKSNVIQLQKENESLKGELAEKNGEIALLRQQLESCRLGLALRDSASDTTGYTREEAKRRINRMVREIEECIALLKQ